MNKSRRTTSDGVVIGTHPKVLHVSPWFMPARSYGGVTEAVYRLCLSLARVGWEVRALTTNADGPHETTPVATSWNHAASAGFDIHYCPRVMPHSVSPGLLAYLIPYVHWADIVHLTGVYSFPTIPTLIACRLLRRPLVWSPRGALRRRNSGRRAAAYSWEILCRMLVPRGTVLHTTSEQEYEEGAKRFPRLKTVVIPNGMVVPKDPAHVPAEGSLRIAYVGRLDPRKGIENLLAACRTLAGEGVPIQVRIAGSGDAAYERQLRSEIAESNLGSRVESRGPVSGTAKRGLFAETDIAVVPSHADSVAVAVAEALAYGVPVIASRGTPWARLDAIGCGRWVDNDPQTLARTIRAMAHEPLAEMGRRGRQWIIDEFSWERVARKMGATYLSLAHNEMLDKSVAGRVSAVPSQAAPTSSYDAPLRGR